MRAAISRYGARVFPETEDIVAGCKARGEFIQGPQIAEFRRAFARRDLQGTAGRNLRCRRAFQLSNAQAAELLRRWHGAGSGPRDRRACPADRRRAAVAE